MRPLIWKSTLTSFALAVLMASCLAKHAQDKSPKVPGKSASLKLLKSNPFANNTASISTFKNALSSVSTEASAIKGLNDEALWAFAICQCAPKFTDAYLFKAASSGGALPQALVPTIRTEVRKSPLLSILLKLPLGAIDATGFLLDIFLRDEKIAKEIRKGLSERLSSALPGGTSLTKDFRFDLFGSPVLAPGYQTAAPRTFRITEQTSKWAMIFAIDNMWKNSEPIGYSDNGVQLLATAKALAEWSYAFGLDDPIAGKIMGGLSFNPLTGINSPLGTYNPKDANAPARIISGTYSVDYPLSKTVDLAIAVNETWERLMERIDLDEQARVWFGAAKAYSRLKPSARTSYTSNLFKPSSGLFPDNVHQLGLAFLPGMAALLQKSFINSKDNSIEQYAAVPGSDASATSPPTKMKSLSRMARALNTWVEQLETIHQDQLDTATVQTLETSLPTLKDALRLSIRNIIGRHVDELAPNTTRGGIGLVMSAQDATKPSMAEAAEVLATMALSEQTVLHTADYGQEIDWRVKIVGLYHWFAAEYLVPLAEGQNKNLTHEDVIWSYVALKVFAKYNPSIHQAPWLSDATKNLEKALDSWQEGLSR